MAKPILLIKLYETIDRMTMESIYKSAARACPDYHVLIVDGKSGVEFEVGGGDPAKAVEISVDEFESIVNGTQR